MPDPRLSRRNVVAADVSDVTTSRVLQSLADAQARAAQQAAAAQIAQDKGSGTVSLAFGGTVIESAGGAYAANSLDWKRIGDTFFWQARITLTNQSTLAGAATVTGFPFSAAVGNAAAYFGDKLNFTGAQPDHALLGGATLNLRVSGGGALTATSFSSNSEFIVNGFAFGA